MTISLCYTFLKNLVLLISESFYTLYRSGIIPSILYCIIHCICLIELLFITAGLMSYTSTGSRSSAFSNQNALFLGLKAIVFGDFCLLRLEINNSVKNWKKILYIAIKVVCLQYRIIFSNFEQNY